MTAAPQKRAPSTLAERFWSIAHSRAPGEPAGDDPKALVRHVLNILDALAVGEVGDGVSTASLSFLALLRQSEAAGDLSYASPEQARGEQIDERSLVFSVGVLLFEQLTGRHPFGVNSARRFARIRKGELGSGVQYFPQVPPAVRTVLMRAMGPFPEERYPSLAELRRALDRFGAGQPQERPSREANDTDKTLVHRRMLPAPPHTPTPPPMRGMPEAKALRFEPISLSPAMPEPARRRRRWPVVVERIGWAALGAAVSIGFVELAPRMRRAAPPVVAVIATAPTPQVTPLPPPPLPTEPLPPTPRFDAAAAAGASAGEVRRCFSRAGTVSFGASLLFAPGDAKVRRAFLSPDDPLAPVERHCLQRALLAASAGAPPDSRVLVEARFRLFADGRNEIKLKQ